MKPLTYSDYINDRSIVEALRIPQPPPAAADGRPEADWPLWHDPAQAGPGVAWSPGDPWPRGGPWSHDEVLFIRVHQGFEVWFAQFLHELDSVLTESDEGFHAAHGELPRVELAERRGDARPHRAELFPKLDEAISHHADGGVADAIRFMPAPGHYAIDAPAPTSWLNAESLERWTFRLRRAAAAMQVTLPFFDVLATLTPAQFLEFRGRLVPASGFGSVQFREMELSLGMREAVNEKMATAAEQRAQAGAGGTGDAIRPSVHDQLTNWGRSRIQQRLKRPTLRDLVYALLNGIAIELWPDEAERNGVFDRFARRNVDAAVGDWHKALQQRAPSHSDHFLLQEQIRELGVLMSHRETIVAALLEMHTPGEPVLKQVKLFIDACLGLDDMLLRWRHRHLPFVEAMIGVRPGTGGGGLKYLRSTVAERRDHLAYGLPCLWQARSLVQNPRSMEGERRT